MLQCHTLSQKNKQKTNRTRKGAKKKKSKQTSRRKVGRGSSQAGLEKGWQKSINALKDLPNGSGKRKLEAALLKDSRPFKERQWRSGERVVV